MLTNKRQLFHFTRNKNKQTILDPNMIRNDNYNESNILKLMDNKNKITDRE